MPELGTSAELSDPTALESLDTQELARALRPLFEDATWLAERLEGRRFASWDEVIEAAASALAQATDREREDVLRSHPRVGHDPDRLKARSAASWQEQGSGQDPGAGIMEALSAANDRYEDHFGFPFVDWVAGRRLEEMLQVIDSRLGASRRTELRRGCQALVDIGRDRLHHSRDRVNLSRGGPRCP